MRCRLRSTMNSGITMRMNGNTWLSRIQPVATPRRRCRKRARAYAAGIASRTTRTVARATIEAVAGRRRSRFCGARRRSSPSAVPRAAGSDWSAASSRGVLKAVTTRQISGKARKMMNPISARYCSGADARSGAVMTPPPCSWTAGGRQEEHDDHDDHHVAHRRGVAPSGCLERLVVGEQHRQHRLAARAARGEDVHEGERVEVPDEVERRDGHDDGPQRGRMTCGTAASADAPSMAAASCSSSGIVLQAGEQRDRRLRHARPDPDDDDRRQRRLEVAQPVGGAARTRTPGGRLLTGPEFGL